MANGQSQNQYLEYLLPFLYEEGTLWDPAEWMEEWGQYLSPIDTTYAEYIAQEEELADSLAAFTEGDSLRNIERGRGLAGFSSSYLDSLAAQELEYETISSQISKMKGLERMKSAERRSRAGIYDDLGLLSGLGAFDFDGGPVTGTADISDYAHLMLPGGGDMSSPAGDLGCQCPESLGGGSSDLCCGEYYSDLLIEEQAAGTQAQLASTEAAEYQEFMAQFDPALWTDISETDYSDLSMPDLYLENYYESYNPTTQMEAGIGSNPFLSSGYLEQWGEQFYSGVNLDHYGLDLWNPQDGIYSPELSDMLGFSQIYENCLENASTSADSITCYENAYNLEGEDYQLALGESEATFNNYVAEQIAAAGGNVELQCQDPNSPWYTPNSDFCYDYLQDLQAYDEYTPEEEQEYDIPEEEEESWIEDPVYDEEEDWQDVYEEYDYDS